MALATLRVFYFTERRIERTISSKAKIINHAMRLATSARIPKMPPYRIPFDSPLSSTSLKTIASSLPHNLFEDPSNLDDPVLKNALDLPKSAAVLIALCNVDDVPGILLEVRGKMRTHSGEIRSVDIAIPE
jgi:hypothetical protein